MARPTELILQTKKNIIIFSKYIRLIQYRMKVERRRQARAADESGAAAAGARGGCGRGVRRRWRRWGGAVAARDPRVWQQHMVC